jgi:hypothetical protein
VGRRVKNCLVCLVNAWRRYWPVCTFFFSISDYVHFKRQALYVYCNIEAPSHNHRYSGKAICVTYSESVVVGVGVQHAVRMRHIFICVPSDSRTFLSRHLVSGTIVRGKLLNVKMVCWFCLQLLSETFLILIRTGRVMIINVYWPSLKLPLILYRF